MKAEFNAEAQRRGGRAEGCGDRLGEMNCFFAKTAKGDADITPASPVGTRTAERISATGVRGKPPARLRREQTME